MKNLSRHCPNIISSLMYLSAPLLFVKFIMWFMLYLYAHDGKSFHVSLLLG